MTRFIDGPAKGQNLSLQRSPFFLRVTFAAAKWDALDQPEDAPRPDEMVYAYRLTRPPARCHINHSDRRKSGFMALAEYEICPEQCPAHIMRDGAAWRQWCDDRKEQSKTVFDSVTSPEPAPAKTPKFSDPNPVFQSVIESARENWRGMAEGQESTVSCSLSLLERQDPAGHQAEPPLDRLKAWAAKAGFGVRVEETTGGDTAPKKGVSSSHIEPARLVIITVRKPKK